MVDDIGMRVGLDTRPFARGLRKAEALGDGFKKTMMKSFASLKGSFLGIFGVTAVASVAKSIIDYGSVLTDVADQADITTSSLQKMGFAFEQGGAAVSDYTNAIKFLRKNIGEALDGKTEFINSFKLLGVTLEDLKNKNHEQLFLQIAENIRQAGTSGNRYAAILEIMGRSADRIIPIMRAGVTDVADAFEKLGGVISDDTLVKLDEIGDRIALIGRLVKKIGAEGLVGGVGFLDELKTATSNLFLFIAAVDDFRKQGMEGRRHDDTFATELFTQINLSKSSFRILEEQEKKLQKILDEKLASKAKLKASEQQEIQQLIELTVKLRELEAKGKEILGDNQATVDLIKEKLSKLEKERDLLGDGLDKLKKQEEIQKARNELSSKNLEIERKATAESTKQRAEEERKADLLAAQVTAKGNLLRARENQQITFEDQAKFSLEDLAASRGRGRFGLEAQGARDVIRLTQFARFAASRNRQDVSINALNRADFIRKQLTNLTTGERFPFRSLEESTANAASTLTEIDRKLAGELKVNSPMKP